MIIKFSLSAAAILASLGWAQAQTAGNIVFQGEDFVTTTSSQCAVEDETVGDFHRVVYRYDPPNTSNDPDSLAFIGTRNANRITPKTGTSLIGRQSDFLIGLNSKASVFGEDPTITTSSDLSIVPVSPAKTIATATNILITGTIENFFDITGCTVTIRAVLTLRVNEPPD